jgi:hypothetical protein
MDTGGKLNNNNMPKVLGYSMVHYGAEYLDACLFSLNKLCDHIVILYSDKPTHHQPDKIIQCPDNKYSMMNIANGYKCQWVDVENIHTEGDHRNLIYKYSKGFDLIVNADSDEVWEYRDTSFMQRALESKARYIKINGFVNFYRSFKYIASEDPWRPIRVINLNNDNKDQDEIRGAIYHFGYAIKPETMEYKISCHGHSHQWRPEFFEMWKNWTPDQRQGKFHSVSYDVWTEIYNFDKGKLPPILKSHPYFNIEII